MKILIYSQYFYPETNAPANRLLDVAKYLSKKNEVTILTGFPNHPLGKMIGGYRMKWLLKERLEGMDIFRSFLIIPKKTNSKIWRYLNYFSFAFSSFWNLFRMKKPDLILVTTPPVSVLILGYIYAKLRKVEMVIDLRDMWPEAAISLKVIKRGVVSRILESLVLKSYNYSKKIIINTEAFRKVLVDNYLITNTKIEYIPNGFDIEANLGLKKDYGKSDEFKIVYSGLFGWAQNVDLIVETAKIFQENNTNVKFILIGDGPLKENLSAKILKYNLKNVEILEYQKKENLFKIISECALGLVTYEINDTFRKNIPSKIFDYMFLKIPVLINLEGEASKMISSGSFGFELETNNPKEFYLKIIEIISNRTELKARGINGFNFLKENFDKKILLEKLNKIIE